MSADDTLPVLRPIPAGMVTVRDRGTTQKLSPTSPSMPIFSRQHARPRLPDRHVDVAAFWLGVVPITNAVRDAHLSTHRPSAAPLTTPGEDTDSGKLAQRPWVNVSWLEAVDFCNRLSDFVGLPRAYVFEAHEVTRLDTDGYRLPTEAEWQRACVDDGALDAIAWTAQNAGDRLQDVGRKQANAFGIYDLLGNVWEWCEDLFNPEVYGPIASFVGVASPTPTMWSGQRCGARATQPWASTTSASASPAARPTNPERAELIGSERGGDVVPQPQSGTAGR